MLSSSSGSRRPGTSSSGGVRQQALAEVERWRRLAEENEKEAMKLKKVGRPMVGAEELFTIITCPSGIRAGGWRNDAVGIICWSRC